MDDAARLDCVAAIMSVTGIARKPAIFAWVLIEANKPLSYATIANRMERLAGCEISVIDMSDFAKRARKGGFQFKTCTGVGYDLTGLPDSLVELLPAQ